MGSTRPALIFHIIDYQRKYKNQYKNSKTEMKTQNYLFSPLLPNIEVYPPLRMAGLPATPYGGFHGGSLACKMGGILKRSLGMAVTPMTPCESYASL